MPSPATARPAPSAVFLLGLALLTGCGRLIQTVPPAHGETVASGLSAPQGVEVDGSGNIWVIDSGTGGDQVVATLPGAPGQPDVQITLGNTAKLVRVDTGGQQQTVTTLPSVGTPFGNSGGARITTLGGDVYVTAGQWSGLPAPQPPQPDRVAAVLRVSGNAATQVANLFAFEAANNPDKVPAVPPTPNGQPGIDSHPYGLTSLNGQLYVADAAGNDLLRVDPATGAVSLVTVFAPLTVPNTETADPNDTIQAQAVPTGLTVGADGALYVALLPGGEVPGTAKVVRVDPATGQQTDWATGLSQLTDVRKGPDGNLYAVQLAPTGPGSGSVVRISAKNSKEVVLGGLNFPTSIAFNSRGDAFIAVNGVSPDGRVVRYDFLTRYKGQ